MQWDTGLALMQHSLQSVCHTVSSFIPVCWPETVWFKVLHSKMMSANVSSLIWSCVLSTFSSFFAPNIFLFLLLALARSALPPFFSSADSPPKATSNSLCVLFVCAIFVRMIYENWLQFHDSVCASLCSWLYFCNFESLSVFSHPCFI